MQASLAGLASQAAGAVDAKSPRSIAIDLVGKSQQGFAEIASEAKKAEATKQQRKDTEARVEKRAAEAAARTGRDTQSKTAAPTATKEVTGEAATGDDGKAAVARVTALYLANSDQTPPDRRAA